MAAQDCEWILEAAGRIGYVLCLVTLMCMNVCAHTCVLCVCVCVCHTHILPPSPSLFCSFTQAHARNLRYMTAFLDGEYVASKSSQPRVRLKTFETLGEPTDLMHQAQQLALRLAHHVVHPIFDAVLALMTPPMSSFGVATHRLCFGGRGIFEALARYVETLLQLYNKEDVPVMVYMAVMDAHEPTLRRVRSIDAPLASLIRRLTRPRHTTGVPGEGVGVRRPGGAGMRGDGGAGGRGGAGSEARETVVVLAGDHGMSYGEFYEKSSAAKLDVKRPSIHLLLPRAMLRRAPDVAANVAGNTLKLTTPFDVHATLLQLLDLHRSITPPLPSTPANPTSASAYAGEAVSGSGWGKSLLAAHPPARRCVEAGVPLQHCACVEMTRATTEQLNSTLFRSLASLGTDHINSLVERATLGRGHDGKVAGSAMGIGGNESSSRCLHLELIKVDGAHLLDTPVMGQTMPVGGGEGVSLKGDALIQVSWTVASVLSSGLRAETGEGAGGVGGTAASETFEAVMTMRDPLNPTDPSSSLNPTDPSSSLPEGGGGEPTRRRGALNHTRHGAGTRVPEEDGVQGMLLRQSLVKPHVGVSVPCA